MAALGEEPGALFGVFWVDGRWMGDGWEIDDRVRGREGLGRERWRVVL